MAFPLAFFDIGGPELMVVLFIFLLLFGANKLPELAKGMGKSIREFKKAANGVEEEFKRALEEEDRPKPAVKPTATIAQQPAAPEKPASPPPPPPTAD